MDNVDKILFIAGADKMGYKFIDTVAEGFTTQNEPEENPDIALMILDIMMPGLNGYEVARHVRAMRCSTPILMLTAKSDLEDRIEGLNAGADYYLTKPFDSRELMACINALLRRQAGQVNEMVFGNTERISREAPVLILEHYETKQILKAIICKNAPWKNHPCTLQYKNYTIWLRKYYYCLKLHIINVDHRLDPQPV